MVLRVCFDKVTLDFLYFFESENVKNNPRAYNFDVPDISLKDCYICAFYNGKPTLFLDQTKVDKQNASILEDKFRSMRNIRDKLLQETDFAMLPDSPFNSQKKNEFIKYRKALRDLPNNIVDINNFKFPTKP